MVSASYLMNMTFGLLVVGVVALLTKVSAETIIFNTKPVGFITAVVILVEAIVINIYYINLACTH